MRTRLTTDITIPCCVCTEGFGPPLGVGCMFLLPGFPAARNAFLALRHKVACSQRGTEVSQKKESGL